MSVEMNSACRWYHTHQPWTRLEWRCCCSGQTPVATCCPLSLQLPSPRPAIFAVALYFVLFYLWIHCFVFVLFCRSKSAERECFESSGNCVSLHGLDSGSLLAGPRFWSCRLLLELHRLRRALSRLPEEAAYFRGI